MINDCKHYTYFCCCCCLFGRINFAKRIKLHYGFYKRNIAVSEMKCFFLPTNHNENPEILCCLLCFLMLFEK